MAIAGIWDHDMLVLIHQTPDKQLPGIYMDPAAVIWPRPERPRYVLRLLWSLSEFGPHIYDNLALIAVPLLPTRVHGTCLGLQGVSGFLLWDHACTI